MSKNPVPVRMCSGCMARRPKSELLRIVRAKEGKAIIDNKGTLSGRGAYICLNEQCIKKAEKKNRFAIGLKGDTGKEIYSELIKLAKGV